MNVKVYLVFLYFYDDWYLCNVDYYYKSYKYFFYNYEFSGVCIFADEFVYIEGEYGIGIVKDRV